jgi:hypothetical protein
MSAGSHVGAAHPLPLPSNEYEAEYQRQLNRILEIQLIHLERQSAEDLKYSCRYSLLTS